MGELDQLTSSNPVYIVIMRNSRGKVFVYIAAVSVLCFIVFLLSSTHSNLKDLEGVNERCQQQRDSLSAQLQVVYEHKNRLEKSLQVEKSEHRHTKELSEKQASDSESKLQKLKDEKQKIDVQLSQLKISYSELEDEKVQLENALKQQLRATQTQKDAEIEKLHTHISDLLAEKDKLENSNNGYIWKIQQHENKFAECQALLGRAKTQLTNCIESQKNTVGDAKPSINDRLTKTQAGTAVKVKHDHVPVPNENEVPFGESEILIKKTPPGLQNKTTPAQSHDKPALLEKPAILPPLNFGDGVLPKPLPVNKDVDAAIEDVDIKKDDKMEDNLLNNINERYEGKVTANKETVRNLEVSDNVQKNAQARDAENHPQVAPPNMEEKDDHAAERGEDTFQYANPDVKQVETPDLNKHNNPGVEKKVLLPPQDNDIMAQVNDMMNKSPGAINNQAEEPHVPLHPPIPHLGPIDNKIQELKQVDSPFVHRGADGHPAMDDKNYEEADDDDRENDDEPANGVVPAAKGPNVLQDNDFDDQENQDNGDNAKEVEGVAVMPK